MAKTSQNPFNYSTTISYKTTVTGRVTMSIYKLSGKKIRTLVNETQRAEMHSVIWDRTNTTGGFAGSGIYFCTFNIDDTPVAIKKLVLFK